MQLVIRPIQDPQRELDVTHRLVSAIADELWRLYGGNDRLNWIEAERHLQRIVEQARADARETQVAVVAPPGAAAAGAQMPGERLGRSDHDERLAPDRAARRGAPCARRGAGAPGGEVMARRVAPERREREPAARLRCW